MTNSIDIIIVGAGPAGLAAATVLARAKKNVAVIERGDFPGSKNMFGGAIYTQPVSEIYPDFWQSAPVERHIIKHNYALLSQKDGTVISYTNPTQKNGMFNAYSVSRSKWDRWCAQQAQDAGAHIVTETLVTELLTDDERVIGVKTDTGEEFFAKIVILADGVNSILSKQLGFHDELRAQDVALSIKEVISLSEEQINERFNLEDNAGCAFTIVGGPMSAMTGMGFIYTGKDTVSIGVGITLEDMQKNFTKPYDILNELKKHPIIAPLIKGGELKEYSAHLIPEGGYHAIPKLYGDGVMIIGDAAMLVNNVHWEGTNLAMISGQFAAQSAIDALEKNDFSKNTLALYEKKLKNSFIIKDMKTYQDVVPTIEKNSEAFLGYYLKKINEFMEMFTSVDSIEKKEKYKNFAASVFKERTVLSLLSDALQAIKLAAGVFLR